MNGQNQVQNIRCFGTDHVLISTLYRQSREHNPEDQKSRCIGKGKVIKNGKGQDSPSNGHVTPWNNSGFMAQRVPNPRHSHHCQFYAYNLLTCHFISWQRSHGPREVSKTSRMMRYLKSSGGKQDDQVRCKRGQPSEGK